MKVLLIDDHPMVNSGLASYLEETGRFTITGKAQSLAQAAEFMENSALNETDIPSLVVLDILLGEENGLDFLPFLENFCKEKQISKPAVLVCSVLEEPFAIQTALKMGASGFMPKTGSKTELLDVIDTILRGEIYISSEYSAKVMKSYGIYSKFTKRELEIYSLIKKNKTNKQIADELCLNIRTIENHVSNIYFKTGAANRSELMGM